jgi:membrane-bound serine protease (ClpP class)
MWPMRRIVFLVLVLALLWPAEAHAVPPTIQIVKVSGALDRPNVEYLLTQLDRAEGAGQGIVLQLDTAGALDENALSLAERVADSTVPVIVWVGPAPATASGAGLLLMYASSLAAVSPGSQTGPLRPLDLASPDTEYPGLRSRIAGWVAEREKDTDLDWSDRPLTAAEARHRGIAQVAAASIPGLLTRIDGRTVETASGPVVLQTALATSEAEGSVVWQFNDLGPIARVLHAMISPSAIYLLLALGLAALAFELTQPGFGFAGFSGIGMLALATYGLWVVPFSWPGLALLLAGIALLAADVRLRRLGPLTWAGLALFVAGSWLVFGGVSSQIDLSPWLIGSLTVATLLYYGFALTVSIQSRDRIASTQRGLVGLVGEARGDLAPEGPVFVKGTLWRGRASDGSIEKGARIRVRGLDGLILRVEAEPGSPASGGASDGPAAGSANA